MLSGNPSEMSCVNYSIIIIYYEVFFCTFFRINFSKRLYYFCILAEENQEVFSERCSLMSGVLQGLVKMCKIYREVNQFLLVSCSTRILYYSLTMHSFPQFTRSTL